MKNTLNFEVGGRIRRLRERSHYTREALAEKADISVQFLADIETGRKSMTIRTLRNIAEALQISTDYIVFGVAQKYSPENASNFEFLIEKLNPNEKHFAEKILKVYLDSLSYAKINE